MADFNELKNSKDYTYEFDASDIQNNKVMGILSYLGILVLVPIFAAKESKFARFHANQGLIVLIFQAAISITLGILAVFLSYVPVVRVLFAVIRWLISTALVLPSVLGIVNAARGLAKEIPLIGGFRILK